MLNRGKLAVSAIVVVAVALALFAWWYRWQQGHRAAEFWGSPTATLIKVATGVELLELQPTGEPTSDAPTDQLEVLNLEGARYAIANRQTLRNTPGLVHARHSLIEDASFLWDESRPNDCTPRWSHAVRFTYQNQTATLAFDFACQQAHSLTTGNTQPLAPHIANGWQKLVEREMQSPAKSE